MDMIPRILVKTIRKNQKNGFINLIYGPRRVGKTVLLKQLTEKILSRNLVWFNGDTRETQEALSNTSQVHLSKLVDKYKYIVVDEAQRIPNIGLSLKFEERDILKNGLDLPNTQEPRLIECTGFWEYLDTNQREALLEKVSKSMGSNDIFVLTALVKNDQQNIFNALKFKKLSPHPLEDLILEVKEHLGNLEKTIVTPNGTYATIVIRK